LKGDFMEKILIIYVHGKNGSTNEAEHYKKFFANSEVVSFDYKSENVWDFKAEFLNFFDATSKNFDKIILIANSIGAYFSMNALKDRKIYRAFFISPIVNLEKLIKNLMQFAKVTENELREKEEIPTDFGENLSWKYLCYVRENKIFWNVPTEILYGEKDNLTDSESIFNFAEKCGAKVTVMKDGEHWFHTDEQIKFLDSWLEKILKEESF